MAQAKKEAAENDGVPFVSTNDVLASWFLQNTQCDFGMMVFNCRNRLAGHTDLHAGSYLNTLFYQRPDSSAPGLIRQSFEPETAGYERYADLLGDTDWLNCHSFKLGNICESQFY